MARRICLIIASLAAMAPAAWACDTPVYRYAMYNWEPAPYRVFYFHRGEPAKEDAEANRLLNEHATATPTLANLAFLAVNLDQKEPFEALPDRVKDVWKSHEKEPLPRHLVFTSWGDPIFAGRLDAAAVRGLVDSPARKQIAELLDKNHALVFLLLCGPDAAENKRAEETAAKVLAQAAAGEIAVESAAGEEGDSEGLPKGTVPFSSNENRDSPSLASRLQVGFVKVNRSDAAESWLVRSLATVERDLPELAGQAMIFPIYGRGRALPPFVGKGITPENLVEAVTFLTGACSCLIKDQNPGVDLLFAWDWAASADRLLAEEDRSARGQAGRRRLAMDSVGELPATATEKEAAGQEGKGGQAAPGAQRAGHGIDTPVPPQIAAEEPVTAPVAPEAAELEAAPYATRQLWRLGIGLVLIAAAVLAVGHVLLRKRHDDSP
jgi:hypothetical protein